MTLSMHREQDTMRAQWRTVDIVGHLAVSDGTQGLVEEVATVAVVTTITEIEMTITTIIEIETDPEVIQDQEVEAVAGDRERDHEARVVIEDQDRDQVATEVIGEQDQDQEVEVVVEDQELGREVEEVEIDPGVTPGQEVGVEDRDRKNRFKCQNPHLGIWLPL